MKLARSGPVGQERPIGCDGTGWRDLSPIIEDITGAVLATQLEQIREAIGSADLPRVPDPGRYGPPLADPGKIVCVGLNYRDHAVETAAAIPEEPILFLKAPDTVVGPYDQIRIPRASTKTDWEVELAVVIGREARYLSTPAESRACIAGYAISHDVSERSFQLERGGQWDKGKNCETFNPLGPWILTADDVADPQSLGLRLWVNGQLRQDGTSNQMIFGVDYLVWYVSQFMVLRPGDVLNTGTPSGVALGMEEPAYLRAGDVVTVEIDYLGKQRQEVVQA